MLATELRHGQRKAYVVLHLIGKGHQIFLAGADPFNPLVRLWQPHVLAFPVTQFLLSIYTSIYITQEVNMQVFVYWLFVIFPQLHSTPAFSCAPHRDFDQRE